MSIEKYFSTIKNFLNKIKENLPLLILVPTILGGVLQLIQLYRISPSYIRFFSLTQVVADGLLFLVLLFFIGLSIIVFIITLGLNYEFNKGKKNEENQDNNIPVNKPSIRHDFFISISFIVISILFFYLITGFSESKFEDLLNLSIDMIIIKILITIYIYSMLLFGIYLLFEAILKYFSVRDRIRTIIIKFLFLNYIIITVLLLFQFAINYQKVQLLNFKNLSTKIQSNLNLDEPPELLYFNDKYIFYKAKVDYTSETFIYSFNKLLEFDYKEIRKELKNESLINYSSKVLEAKVAIEKFSKARTIDDLHEQAKIISNIILSYDNIRIRDYSNKLIEFLKIKSEQILNEEYDSIINEDILEMVEWVKELEREERNIEKPLH